VDKNFDSYQTWLSRENYRRDDNVASRKPQRRRREIIEPTQEASGGRAEKGG
jgi:hypothetical protein